MDRHDGVIQPKEAFNVAKMAIHGDFKYGHGPLISLIAQQIEEDNPHITKMDLLQKFEEYWYENMLMRKYDARYKPSTFIIGCLKWWIMNERKRYWTQKADRARHIPWRGEDVTTGDEVYNQKEDGVWKQHNIITDFNMTACSGVEEAYLRDELESLIESFTREEYGNTYLDLYHGKISQSEAAEVEGCTRRTIINRWSRYKDDLVRFLIKNGYDEMI